MGRHFRQYIDKDGLFGTVAMAHALPTMRMLRYFRIQFPAWTPLLSHSLRRRRALTFPGDRFGTLEDGHRVNQLLRSCFKTVGHRCRFLH